MISNIVVSFALTSSLGIRYLNPSKEMLLKNEMEELSFNSLSQLEKAISTKVEEVVKKQKKVVTVTPYEYTSSIHYTPAQYSEVTGNAVVEYAKKYLGLRYVSGGYSLSTGTDCSGFTKLIYQEFGVYLSRSPQGQANNGTYIRKSDLQKGDLVFYGNGNGQISHVGIYIGNNQVLHESNPRDGVKISSVNMMQYITARRVINSVAIKKVEDDIAKEKEASLENEVVEEDLKEDKQDDTNTVIEEKENNIDTTIDNNEIEENNSINMVEDLSDEVIIEKSEEKIEEVKDNQE